MTIQTEATVETAITALKANFRGALLTLGDPGYDEASALWNGMIDKRPKVIAKCKGVADVMDAVKFAREHRLTIAVRGGGHNVAGLASVDGGLVIDLSEMNSVHVDYLNRVARVEGGATISDLDRETQAFGLAVPMGVVSATGVAGLTLGGGMGWLRRKYGLSCDNLLAAEVATAEGKLVRASESENPDLLWGLRGGGGNFGIVTSFEFRLYPVGPEVAFTFVFYPLQEARKVLYAHEDFLQADVEGSVSTLAVLGRVPHAEPFPEAIHGTPFVGILGMYAGEADEGLAFMRPLREVAEPLIDLSGPMPFAEVQRVYDADYPNGLRYYWKSTNLMQLETEAIDLLVKHAERAPSDHATIDIWYHGGAVARPSADATAYGRRDVPYLVNPEANWERPEDDEVNIAWVRTCLSELEAHSAGGLYLNFPGFQEEGEAMTKAAYGNNYARLVALKTKYDSTNFFRLNANIRPEGTP